MFLVPLGIGYRQFTSPVVGGDALVEFAASALTVKLPAEQPVGPDRLLWAAADSVDSQMQPLTSSVRIKANATPSQLDDLDPFARVSKNSDL